jgi:MoaA/NifB/PqqE/SkfB family radical SAM enzyme
MNPNIDKPKVYSMQPDRVYGFETGAAEVFPRYVMYDVNNVCNARCPFCPQSAIARGSNFVPQHIDWDHYVKTIEEVAEYPVELVRFTGDGEPLLHPRMADMIEKALSLGVSKINLTTNGSLLRDARLERMLAAPPHIIDFSIDAFVPETYAKYRIGLEFETTMKNVLGFLERRDLERTKVIVSMILHPGLENEAEQFRLFWESKVDQVAIRRLHSNLGSVDVEQAPLPNPRWPCAHLWQRLVIDFRGHIRFCPVDWHDQSFVGEVDSMTLREAWHSKLLRGLRETHLSDRYTGCGVCEKCTDWANTPWGESWVNMIQTSLQAEGAQS